jgi:hypothetical protein
MEESDERFGRNVSSSRKQQKKQFTSLFAYDSNENKYTHNQEIEELEVKYKNAITTTLNKFNEELKSTISHVSVVSLLCYFFIYLLSLCVLVILLYLSILFCALCLFNPMIIIGILFFGLTKGIALFYLIHCKIMEKIKAKKMNNLIKNENKQDSELKWTYGRDGSWIEVTIVKNK